MVLADCLYYIVLQLSGVGNIALLAVPDCPTSRLSEALGYNDKGDSRSIGICILSSLYGSLFTEIAPLFCFCRYVLGYCYIPMPPLEPAYNLCFSFH